jgi:hypothetical protein
MVSFLSASPNGNLRSAIISEDGGAARARVAFSGADMPRHGWCIGTEALERAGTALRTVGKSRPSAARRTLSVLGGDSPVTSPIIPGSFPLPTAVCSIGGATRYRATTPRRRELQWTKSTLRMGQSEHVRGVFARLVGLAP